MCHHGLSESCAAFGPPSREVSPGSVRGWSRPDGDARRDATNSDRVRGIAFVQPLCNRDSDLEIGISAASPLFVYENFVVAWLNAHMLFNPLSDGAGDVWHPAILFDGGRASSLLERAGPILARLPPHPVKSSAGH